MGKLLRVFVVFVVLIFGAVLDASATTHPVDYPATQKWSASTAAGVTWFGSWDAACQFQWGRLPPDWVAYYVSLVAQNPSCRSSQNGWSAAVGGPAWKCDDDSDAPLKNGAYICTKMVEDDPPPSCTKGQMGQGTYVQCSAPHGTDFDKNPPAGCGKLPTNDGFCEIHILSVEGCWASPSGATDTAYCKFTWEKTGRSVSDSGGSPSPPDGPGSAGPGSTQSKMPPTDAPDGSHCPAGSVAGGVDSSGITICVGSGRDPGGAMGGNSGSSSSTTTKPATTTTNADGSTVKSQDTITHNSDGSDTTTTTTETTKADGSKDVTVVSTTSKKPDGSSGKPDPNPDQQDFCKLHPDLTICSNSSVSGACGQITCMGDAIQCATLRAAAAMQCKQKQDDDDLKASGLYSLGSGVVGGTDPQSDSLPTKANAAHVDVPSTLDTSGWLGGGGCFVDKSFSVQGHTFVVPFSKSCDYLLGLRYALMAAAMLVSFRMLSGVILRD